MKGRAFCISCVCGDSVEIDDETDVYYNEQGENIVVCPECGDCGTIDMIDITWIKPEAEIELKRGKTYRFPDCNGVVEVEEKDWSDGGLKLWIQDLAVWNEGEEPVYTSVAGDSSTIMAK